MRTRKKVAVALFSLFVVCAVVYMERINLAVWFLEGNKAAHEDLILQMLAYAKPVIQAEFKMTLPEKIISALASYRNQKKRQADALKDVRSFCAQSFANHRLKFANAHRLGSLGAFDLHGYDFALAWYQGKTAEALAAFNVNLLKREVGAMSLNENCGFFAALRLYVETRAKEN